MVDDVEENHKTLDSSDARASVSIPLKKCSDYSVETW
jgi:hypothetical protein